MGLVGAYAGAVLLVALGGLDVLSAAGSVRADLAVASMTIYLLLALLGLLAFGGSRATRLRLLLAGFSVLLVLGVVELAGRALQLPAGMMRARGVASERYHHLSPRNRTMFQGVTDGVPVIVRTNEDGLRSDYSRAEFLTHRTRIAVLGDSFTFGLNVRQEKTVPAALERRLRAELGDDVAVLNAGIISSSPYLQRILYEGIVKHYEPQVVLVILDATDIGDDARYATEARLIDGEVRFDLKGPAAAEVRYYGVVAQLLSPAFQWLSYPFEVLARRLSGGDGEYDYYEFADAGVEIDGVAARNRYFIYRFAPQATRRFFEATLQNVVETQRAAQRTGARFSLVVSPRYHHWSDKECPDNWEAGDYALDEPYEFAYLDFFREASQRLDFPVVELLPEFQATQAYPLVFASDPHWNERGCEFVAGILARHLLRTSLASRGD